MDIGKQLSSGHWTVETCSRLAIPSFISERYPWLPEDLTEFMETHSRVVSNDGGEWFATSKSILGEVPDALLAWNHPELYSLELEDDSEWKTMITNYWNRHFPFYYSGNRCAYAAIRKENLAVASGVLPYGEDDEDSTPLLAANLEEFLEMVLKGNISFY